jgi:hypothetical protein
MKSQNPKRSLGIDLFKSLDFGRDTRGLSYAFLVLCALLIKMQFACERGREGNIVPNNAPKNSCLVQGFFVCAKTICCKFNDFFGKNCQILKKKLLELLDFYTWFK